MELSSLISAMERAIGDPRKGLPEEMFLFVSQMLPLVNVDLFIRNENGETLLTWRRDEYYGSGWHIPGGIIRFKERIADRISAVANTELGTTVQAEASPMAMHELMSPTRNVRGHFISLLYRCSLTSPPAPDLACIGGAARPGEWAWHRRCPEDLIAAHNVYRRYIDNPD